MKGATEEWAEKAEADFTTAIRELKAPESPNFDAVCFQAQQCIEKLMEALLIRNGAAPPRTHDLTELDRLLGPISPTWSWQVTELRFLTRAGVAFRYPGESADREEASESLDISTRMRAKLRALLGLSI
jgi:HEPN domain-containing protein